MNMLSFINANVIHHSMNANILQENAKCLVRAQNFCERIQKQSNAYSNYSEMTVIVLNVCYICIL